MNYLNFKENLISKYDYKSKSVIKYYNIACGFDIETTSTYVNGEKFSFMYIWTFGINDKITAHGRTWDDFINYCISLVTDLDLTIYKRLIVYVHNLAFEFQFMRKYFNWINVFSGDDRKPIYAVTDLGIEFRDSYILSALSLELTAKNLIHHDIKKLVGDLDYNKIRNSKTSITKQEMGYIDNDVLIILAYINEQIEQYGNITKIPLTNTGRVRQFMKNKCYGKKSHKKVNNNAKRYHALMSECILDIEQYKLLKRCFQGGFTHASIQYTGKKLKDVSSIDFTSSYPYVMVSELFPMSKPIAFTRKLTYIEILQSKRGSIFDCIIRDLHSYNTFESYISFSKCRNAKGVISNNGRVFQADYIEISLTNIDLEIITKCYSFSDIEILKGYSFYMQYLPNQIINGILELYQKKTELKGVTGKEQEYLVSKQMINSVYGMSVTDIIRDLIEYDNSNEWHTEKGNYEEQLQKHNESKNRFLYYPWGVFVTAYARKNLWQGIIAIGNDYVYSDTDSIKFLNYENHKEFIEDYNKSCELKLKKMCDFCNIDYSLTKPKTIKGIEKRLGIFDYEGTYKYFKTLGAKRYIYTDDKNKLHITIAGLSKNKGSEYISKQKNPYNFFDDDMIIPKENTGKNTHTYIDDEKTAKIVDYQGNEEIVTSKSGVHLESTSFNLSMSENYLELVYNMQRGLIKIGQEIDIL